jgi:hypothetical protein
VLRSKNNEKPHGQRLARDYPRNPRGRGVLPTTAPFEGVANDVTFAEIAGLSTSTCGTMKYSIALQSPPGKLTCDLQTRVFR